MRAFAVAFCATFACWLLGRAVHVTPDQGIGFFAIGTVAGIFVAKWCVR